MVIRVTGVTAQKFYTDARHSQTKFYQPQTPKQTIKEDFGIVLDKEIKRLHFERVV